MTTERKEWKAKKKTTTTTEILHGSPFLTSSTFTIPARLSYHHYYRAHRVHRYNAARLMLSIQHYAKEKEANEATNELKKTKTLLMH